MSHELKPCPFCGGKSAVLGGGRNIHCGNEGCFMTSVWAKAETADLAAQCWNTRADQAQPEISYQTGTPPKTGIYACRVPFDAMERPENSRLTRDEFLLWYDDRWTYRGSDQIYRGTLLGWIGPLPRPRFDAAKELA